jgi:methionyl-tRNA formyltransferase
MLRVAFAGTPQFAVPTLRALADSAHQLVGVLTQPDRPAGRGRKLTASPIKTLAQQLGVPFAQPAQLRTPADLAALGSWAPDVLVVVAYGLILPREVLGLPPQGCLNVHASLLPRWRGAAPVQRAILAGDRDTGVSIMLMDEGLDTGPVLAQQSVPIGPAVTTAQLLEELAPLGAGLLLQTLGALEAGRLQPQPQSEQHATYAPKIDRQLAQIDWGLTAEQIERQVRAFNPWPVAHTLWYGDPLRIWEAHVLPEAEVQAAIESVPASISAVPGTVLGVSHDRLLILCGQGILAVSRVQLAGRRTVSAREFANAEAPLGARLGT